MKRIIIAIIAIAIIFLLSWLAGNRRPKIEMAMAAPIINNPVLGATKLVNGKIEKLTLANAKTPQEYKIRKTELVAAWKNTFKPNKQILVLGAAGEMLDLDSINEFISMVNKEIQICPIQNVSVNGDVVAILDAYNSHIEKYCL